MCIIGKGCISLWVIGLRRNTRGYWPRIALGNAWCVKTESVYPEGFSPYDLGGTPGKVPKNKHPNYWLWRFKKRFNGNYVESLPYYTYVFNKNLYLIYKISIPIYKKFRKNFLRV